MKTVTTLVLSLCLSGIAFAAPPVPRRAGDFRMVEPAGQEVKLGDYRGKVVLMQFLYTSCPHCQATARMLSKLQAELGPKGLQVLGVAFNPEARAPGIIGNFVSENGVNFPVGAATLDATSAYLGFSLMDRFVVPQIMIVDRRGMIRAQSEPTGTPELQSETYLRTFLAGLLKR